MNFKLGVFLLFIMFSLACSALQFMNCDQPQLSWVQNAIKDAVYLASRAAQTLEEVLNSPSEIPIQVEAILDTLLGDIEDNIEKINIYQGFLGKSY